MQHNSPYARLGLKSPWLGYLADVLLMIFLFSYLARVSFIFWWFSVLVLVVSAVYGLRRLWPRAVVVWIVMMLMLGLLPPNYFSQLDLYVSIASLIALFALARALEIKRLTGAVQRILRSEDFRSGRSVAFRDLAAALRSKAAAFLIREDAEHEIFGAYGLVRDTIGSRIETTDDLETLEKSGKPQSVMGHALGLGPPLDGKPIIAVPVATAELSGVFVYIQPTGLLTLGLDLHLAKGLALLIGRQVAAWRQQERDAGVDSRLLPLREFIEAHSNVAPDQIDPFLSALRVASRASAVGLRDAKRIWHLEGLVTAEPFASIADQLPLAEDQANVLTEEELTLHGIKEGTTPYRQAMYLRFAEGLLLVLSRKPHSVTEEERLLWQQITHLLRGV